MLVSLYVEHHFSDLGDALVGLHNGLVGRTVGKLEVWLGLHGQTGLLKVVCVEQRRKVCLRHVGQGVHPDDEVLVELVRPNNDKSHRGDVVVHLFPLLQVVVQQCMEEMSDKRVIEEGHKK